MNEHTAGAPRETGADARWTRLAGHPAAPALLFAFAVVEGCLFPAPTEALYAALALARPRRSWALAAVAAAGSVVGGVVAWMLGTWLLDHAAGGVMRSGRQAQAMEAIRQTYRENTALALITSGYTPFPYVLYGIVAGGSGVPLGKFVLFSAIGRGLKYAILAGIARAAGPTLRRWMGRSRIAVIAVVVVIALLAVMAFVR